MKQAFLFLASLILFAAPAFGQTADNPPTLQDLGFSSFSMTASALAIHGNGQTQATTDLGQALALTTNSSIRLDEVLAGGNSNFTGYLAGAKYFLKSPKVLASTTLAPLQLYVSGEGGITRTTPISSSSGAPVNQFAARAIFGANWNPKTTGAVSFNIGEIGYAYLPGLIAGHSNFLTASVGIKVSLP